MATERDSKIEAFSTLSFYRAKRETEQRNESEVKENGKTINRGQRNNFTK